MKRILQKVSIFFIFLLVIGLGLQAVSVGNDAETVSPGVETVIEKRPTALVVAEGWEPIKEERSKVFEDILENCTLRAIEAPHQNEVLPHDARVISLSRALTAGYPTTLSKVFSIYEFASQNITYVRYTDWRDASEVLDNLEGDCTDKSIAMVSLLKATGIEAYVVGSNKEDKSHAWVAVNVNGDWVQLDPTVEDYDYTYECLEEECEYTEFYKDIDWMFNDEVFFECS